MNTITLSLANGVWVATYTGPESADILELFGTTTLPTAYTEKTPGHVVASAVGRLNPNSSVIVSQEQPS